MHAMQQMLNKWYTESLPAQLKLLNTQFDTFVQSLLLDEYQQLLTDSARSPDQQPPSREESHDLDNLVDALRTEVQEVARLEFLVMWQRVKRDLDGQFERCLRQKKGLEAGNSAKALLT